MNIFHHISPDTMVFPWEKRTPLRGLLSTIAIALSLVLGQLTGHPSAGSIAAGAAFTVGFAVFHEALASTLLSMALLTLGIASATLAGSLGASHTWSALVLAVIAAVNYGLLSGISDTAGWIGQQCAVFLVIATGFAHGPHYAVGRASMVMLGGAMQMVVYAATYLIRRGDRARPPLLRQLHTRVGQIGREVLGLLRGSSHTTSYVLRLALVLLLTGLVERREHLANGYWAPMTAVLVLKPQWTGTLSRGVARLLGTLLGAGAALVLAQLHTFPDWLTFSLILLFAWGCYALQAVNYAVFSFSITLYVVFSFRFGGFSQPAAAHLRLLNTAIGGVTALVVDVLWQVFSPPLPAQAPANSATEPSPLSRKPVS